MWAQLVTTRLKPNQDATEVWKQLQAVEQPGSGLVRTLVMHDQQDPSRLYTLVVFEDEEKARARERDPRRQEGLEAARELMAEVFEGPPGFTDLVVTDEVAEHPNAATVRRAYEAIAGGDLATMAALLDEHVVWHESTPGFEGDYRGRDETMALLARVFEETGVEMTHLAIHDILAGDDHAVVLHESTLTRGDRTMTGQYADVYHVRDGRATEHWHLAVDPTAEREFFGD